MRFLSPTFPLPILDTFITFIRNKKRLTKFISYHCKNILESWQSVNRGLKYNSQREERVWTSRAQNEDNNSSDGSVANIMNSHHTATSIKNDLLSCSCRPDEPLLYDWRSLIYTVAFCRNGLPAFPIVFKLLLSFDIWYLF